MVWQRRKSFQRSRHLCLQDTTQQQLVRIRIQGVYCGGWGGGEGRKLNPEVTGLGKESEGWEPRFPRC